MRGLIHYARLLISNSKPKEFEVTTWTNILRASMNVFLLIGDTPNGVSIA